MHEPTALCTMTILVVTVLCSFIGFRDPGFCERYLFGVREILALKQHHRLVTSAFLHSGWTHLTLNMVGLYLFGSSIELGLGAGRFALIYFGAIVGGDALSLWLHRHHEYRAYGASGGVCGLVFSHVLLFPGSHLSSFFLPGSLPAWLYAVLYLVGSFVALKRQDDSVGHDAHLGGALIGFWITAMLEPWAVRLQPKTFIGISVLDILLFVYLLKNPMFLPLSSFRLFRRSKGTASVRSTATAARNEERELDVVLEKISKSGFDSLTAEEKSLLNSVSAKYRRRAESKKPQSDLII